ncbi:MAG TPA: tetratricopeptide repeat protein [Steroidobacteraceae bacterium]|nr:tetratricopeptide repeat protein [Steroidobacteraceae bacterium]
MHRNEELSAQLARASALLNEGRLSQAEGLCRTLLASHPANPSATHLLGLIRARGGDAPGGERLLRRSIELEPRNPALRVNLANHLRRSGRLTEAETEYRSLLALAPGERSARHSLALTLSDLGRHADAESECRRLISANEPDAEAWCLLGLILDRQQRLADSEAAYRQAVRIAPAYGLAYHNLSSVLERLDRAEEALAALERGQDLGIRGFEVAFTRGKVLALLHRVGESEQAFAEAVALRPRDGNAQLNLARLRYMQGDEDFARSLVAAVAAHPDDVHLHVLLTRLLARAGQHEQAERRLAEALRRLGPAPELLLLLSQVLRETERLAEAETHALEAASALPGDSGVIENLVSILLSRGRPDDAMPFVRKQRAREPLGQNWLAYEATAARLLGESRYQELFDYPRFVRCYQIEPPRGWSSMEQLNGALMEALCARHAFQSHPLDQSLLHGSQTTRNLIADPDPAIQAIVAAFAEPMRQYQEELGYGGEHPLLARNRGTAVIKAAWSVQLHRGGFHVNHYHNQGWISSAYYVGLPDEVNDEALKSGWLNFGAPRFATPHAEPAYHIRPRVGMLVLFPSYMWHGTNAIHGGQMRTTIAFDAVPTGPAA